MTTRKPGTTVQDMARPDEWRGSDLRSRAEVVQYLVEHGGVVEDDGGLVAGTMREELGKGRALTQLLADMEKDGMIRREIRGRRTFKIELLDDWGLVGQAPRGRHLQIAPQSTDLRNLSAADLNYDKLAQALLTNVTKVLSGAQAHVGDTSAQRSLASRLQKSEDALRKANDQLKQLRAQVRVAEERAADAERRAQALERNIKQLQAELDKPRRSRDSGGVPIRERLSPSEQAMLASLMRELPETPESKPRRRTQ